LIDIIYYKIGLFIGNLLTISNSINIYKSPTTNKEVLY